MQLFQSLFLAIASFFGFANDTVMPEQAPAEVPQSEVAEMNDDSALTQPVSTSTMLVAGGCFWCVEADLEKVPGVIEVVSGYAGGETEYPTYDTYKAAGHREVVEVTYDTNRVSFEDILIVTMKTTDPTDDDGTFYDRGDGYSAAFYYENEEQLSIINDLITEVDTYGPYDEPLAIDVEERIKFWPAEDYHQNYYKGTLSKLKYQYYRNASGRNDFIATHWGDDTSPTLPWRSETTSTDSEQSEVTNSNEIEAMNMNTNAQTNFWLSYTKPDDATLRAKLDDITYKVTQKDGTERAGTSPLDKVYEPGIYVDVLSGEPLFSSRDKFDSGTGWPSFTKPISNNAVTEHDDWKLFSKRTEVRSAIADNHLGHVFPDGPADQGGLRYCMNGAALEFVPQAEMEERGYGEYLSEV